MGLHQSSRTEGRDSRNERVAVGDQVLVGKAHVGPGIGTGQILATVLSISPRNSFRVQFVNGMTASFEGTSVFKIVTGKERFLSGPSAPATPAGVASTNDQIPNYEANLGNKK